MGVQERVHEAVRAILSDDHNYQLGVRAARQVAEAALAAGGHAELVDMIVAMSLKLAETLERIAAEQGLAAVDLAEVWLVA